MTTNTETKTRNLYFDDPAFLAAITDSPELKSAIEHFNKTSSRFRKPFTPAIQRAVVTAKPYEYDLDAPTALDPPSENNVSERDLFNTEESLLPKLFGDETVKKPDAVVTVAVNETLAEPGVDVAGSEGFEPPSQVQVPLAHTPVADVDSPVTSGDANLPLLEVKTPEDEDSEPEPLSLLSASERAALREAPEPPRYAPNPEAYRADISVPVLVTPPVVVRDDDYDDAKPHGRNSRGVASLLDDSTDTVEDSSNDAHETNYADSLYASNTANFNDTKVTDEVIDAPTVEVAAVPDENVEVAAKKKRFARKTREPKVPKVKVPKNVKKPRKPKTKKAKVSKRVKTPQPEAKTVNAVESKTSKRRGKSLVLVVAVVLSDIVFALAGWYVGVNGLPF